MTQIAILIPAAGASSRMGGVDKLMQNVDGTPLLARVSNRAQDTGLPVFITVPSLSHPRAKLIKSPVRRLITVPDWKSGMAASIRAGIRSLPEKTQAVMILPADMPDLRTDDLITIIHTVKSVPKAIVRATSSNGTPGHPVVFPAEFFGELQAITGDQGARSVAAAHKNRIIFLPLPGNNALTDLDTPADWAAWRANRPVQ